MKYGIFGGQYVPQELITQLNSINKYFTEAIADPEFIKELKDYLTDYVGRPSPLYYAKNLSKKLGSAKIYLKREDLNHTGAHKINNAIGQALLAKRMNKTHIIAETGAGQHGVATATACALLNLKCTIFMGSEDISRQRINVDRMKMLGAEVKEVSSGTATLKEAVDEAFQYLLDHQDVYYLIGSAVGPEPYPQIVKYFQSVIGAEAKEQIMEKEQLLPNAIIACVGGGSNAIGIFSSFLNDDVKLYGVESAGKGIKTKKHASAIQNNQIGIVHGMKTYGMFDDKHLIQPAYSISSGLDYPAIGPEHALFHYNKRVTYTTVTDDEAISAFLLLSRTEGIIPALESAHAIAYACKLVPSLPSDQIVIINLSGRGDKDLLTVFNYKKEE